MLSDDSDVHTLKTRVVCVENTHNWCGGRILPSTFLASLKEICDKNHVKIHLDGARIMNASIATNTSVKDLTKHCDSVNLCFSKVKSLDSFLKSIKLHDKIYMP
jgi:threonine aldolase